MTLGEKITRLRKARGMTQEELSEAVGVTRQTISKWELDSSTPDLDYLCKLCDLFGVTADDLIRPERETVEALRTPLTEEAPPLTEAARPHAEPPPAPLSSAPTRSDPRFPGWVSLIIGLVFIQTAFLFILRGADSTVLWLVAGGFVVIGLELLLIRWEPLFIAAWTVWLIWSVVQFILVTGIAIILFFICFALWVFYTAFCIGATVAVIRRRIRAKRAGRQGDSNLGL